MRLISKKDLGQVGKVSFSGKSFDSVVRLVSKFFQYFKYAYLVYDMVFLYLFWFVRFEQMSIQNLAKHPRWSFLRK